MTTVEDRKTGERVQTCDCEKCHYCETYVAPRHEHDHFPVPKSAGGTEVVPACMNCHELKDRTSLVFWPGDLAAKGIAEVVAIIKGVAEADYIDPVSLASGVHDYREHWPTWSMAGRLFYAKTSFLAAVSLHRAATKVGE